jgi:hypothetical protein
MPHQTRIRRDLTTLLATLLASDKNMPDVMLLILARVDVKGLFREKNFVE